MRPATLEGRRGHLRRLGYYILNYCSGCKSTSATRHRRCMDSSQTLRLLRPRVLGRRYPLAAAVDRHGRSPPDCSGQTGPYVTASRRRAESRTVRMGAKRERRSVVNCCQRRSSAPIRLFLLADTLRTSAVNPTSAQFWSWMSWLQVPSSTPSVFAGRRLGRR